MQTKHLEHKHGGRITEIHYVGHEVEKGVPWYFFIGDIEWPDGKKSCDMEIAPNLICFDHDIEAAHAECNVVMKKLNDYLLANGKWHDRKGARNGCTFSWTPAKPKLQLAI